MVKSYGSNEEHDYCEDCNDEIPKGERRADYTNGNRRCVCPACYALNARAEARAKRALARA